MSERDEVDILERLMDLEYSIQQRARHAPNITGHEAIMSGAKICREAIEEIKRLRSQPPFDEVSFVRGVARDAAEPRSVSVGLFRAITDDEMRSLHDYLRNWRPHTTRSQGDDREGWCA